MDTSSAIADFEAYVAYARDFASRRVLGRVCSTAVPVTLARYLALREAAGSGEELERLLFPSPERDRRVCLVSILGFSEAARAYEDELRRCLEHLGVEVIDPWEWLDGTLDRRAALQTAREGCRAVEDCGRVLAVFDGGDVHPRVATKVGYALALGRRIDGLRVDRRQAADPDGVLDPDLAGAILDSGGRVIQGLEELPELFED